MSETQGESCQLIGLAGIIVQLILAGLSFSVLIYKRMRQQPKRAWKIWAMDTSKQGMSQLLAHMINVVISVRLSQQMASDACVWYFCTNVLDNTLGVFVSIGALKLVEKYLLENRFPNWKSGNYYSILYSYEMQQPPSLDVDLSPDLRSLQIQGRKTVYAISYIDWGVQFAIWNAIVVVSKTLVFYIQILLSGPIVAVSMVLFSWIQPYETIQLILVIIVVPVIMNGLAFWIQDNVLMKQPGQSIKKENNRQSGIKSQAQTECSDPSSLINEPLL